MSRKALTKKTIFKNPAGALNDFSSGTGDSTIPVQFPTDINQIQSGIDTSTDFHVNALKQQFNDVARPNLFKVKLNPPTPLVDEWNNNFGLMFLVKSVSIPQMSIKEWTYERAGQKVYIPTNQVEFGDCTITFYNDSDFILRTLFNRWQRICCYNWHYNMGPIPLLTLAGSVEIFHYDSQLNETYAIRLTNAWPQTLSAIELSQESENVAEEFTVEFKYTMQEMFYSGDVNGS